MECSISPGNTLFMCSSSWGMWQFLFSQCLLQRISKAGGSAGLWGCFY